MKRAYVWAIALVVVAGAAAGVLFLLTPFIVNAAATTAISQATGVPVRVEAQPSSFFLVDGRIPALRVYSPSFQLNGLTLRQLDLTVRDVRVRPLSFLGDSPEVVSVGEATGTVVVAPGDVNDFLAARNMNARIDIRDHDCYLTTYLAGIGRIVLSGRFTVEGSTITFEPMRVVEPRLASLLFAPGLWKSAGFELDIAPLDEVFDVERVFIGTSNLEVSLRLKEGALEAYASGGNR